jgi:hypothetical protein
MTAMTQRRTTPVAPGAGRALARGLCAALPPSVIVWALLIVSIARIAG